MPTCATFLRNRPTSFIGLTPEGALDRYWRFTLFGAYVQDECRLHPRLTLNGGLRYEFTTMPEDIYGRDSALINLTDPAPTAGPLYQNPTTRTSRRASGFAWDVFGDGRTSVRGGYGLYFNTNNQQNLIVTVTNPPATPRVVIANPDVSRRRRSSAASATRSGPCSGTSRTRACTSGTSACSASCRATPC